LITDESVYAPLPNPNPATGSTVDITTVQDVTWYLGNWTNDTDKKILDYYAKYTFTTT
jgi:rhamnogalacturonan endolyase